MSSPFSQSFLSKCTTTVFCYLRFAPLWIVAIAALLFGALRTRIFGPSCSRRQASPRAASAQPPSEANQQGKPEHSPTGTKEE